MSITGRIRLATWNVERPRPRGWRIPPAQRARMAVVDADIWVLTETSTTHSPTDEHAHVAFSPEDPVRLEAHERTAAIWSKWPLEPITEPAPHRRGTVAAIVETPLGPILAYGSVIAWANERRHNDGRPARMWEVHMAEIARQGAEWRQLRARWPGMPFVVAGDLNQDRDASGWYGTKTARALLGKELARAGLSCATDIDVVTLGLLRSQHLIDHVCVSGELSDRPVVSCWENVDDAGQRLSDHPTVAVDLHRRQ